MKVSSQCNWIKKIDKSLNSKILSMSIEGHEEAVPWTLCIEVGCEVTHPILCDDAEASLYRHERICGQGLKEQGTVWATVCWNAVAHQSLWLLKNTGL